MDDALAIDETQAFIDAVRARTTAWSGYGANPADADALDEAVTERLALVEEIGARGGTHHSDQPASDSGSSEDGS